MPKAIVSDRGTNFTSKLFRYFCKKLNIDQRLTTAYNPASNGETERFNRTLTSMLRKELKDGNHINWEDMLDDVLFAYRSSSHSSTLETPYYLVHGNIADRLRYSFQRVREQSEKAQNSQREQYNKRAKERKYINIVPQLKAHPILKIDSENRLQLKQRIYLNMTLSWKLKKKKWKIITLIMTQSKLMIAWPKKIFHNKREVSSSLLDLL
ncbi:Retrovirus-related Pol polyprotein [Daphnia sinensis]|uniref:Retrovirus-related Pol polyprotein n=1 Tax=Daphnia sinensis TaxID=1820382 RepID=A0AAD5L484_9CRUS|nr:Retrovirus-related Pol polyprotein [Daphnia sinensis]